MLPAAVPGKAGMPLNIMAPIEPGDGGPDIGLKPDSIVSFIKPASAIGPTLGRMRSIGATPMQFLSRYRNRGDNSWLLLDRQPPAASAMLSLDRRLVSGTAGDVVRGSDYIGDRIGNAGSVDVADQAYLHQVGTISGEFVQSSASLPVLRYSSMDLRNRYPITTVAGNTKPDSSNGNESFQGDKPQNAAAMLPLAPHFKVQQQTGTAQSPSASSVNRQFATLPTELPQPAGEMMSQQTVIPGQAAESENPVGGQTDQSTDELVDKVWRRIMRKFALEQERGGWNLWP